jgi:hypothetical protein
VKIDKIIEEPFLHPVDTKTKIRNNISEIHYTRYTQECILMDFRFSH